MPRWQSQPGSTCRTSPASTTSRPVPPALFHHRRCQPEHGPEPDQPGHDYTFRNGVPTNVTDLGGAVRVGRGGPGHLRRSRRISGRWAGRRSISASATTTSNNSTGGYTLAAGSVRPGARVAGGEEHAALAEPQSACRRRLRPVRHRQDGAKASLGRYTSQVRSTNALNAGRPPASRLARHRDAGTTRNGNYVPTATCRPAPTANAAPGQISRSARTWSRPRMPRMRFEASTARTTTGRARSRCSTSCGPGVALNVGYFRTWYGGFLATRNLAREPGDRLRRVSASRRRPTRGCRNSGERLCGLYDLKPAKFGQVDNLVTQQSNFGEQTQVYNGVDVTIDRALRPRRAVLRRPQHRAHGRRQLRRRRIRRRMRGPGSARPFRRGHRARS